MPNISTQNPIGYCLDKIDTLTSGVLITQEGSGFDCRNAPSVKSFEFDFKQPSGTFIYILFRSDDSENWFKLDSSGNSVPLDNSDDNPDYDVLSQFGNTVNELSKIHDIPAFVGKYIQLAIGLGSIDANNAIPTIKLGLTVSSDTQQMNTSELSPIYELGNSGLLADIQYKPVVSGSGSVSIMARLTKRDGSLTDWLTPTAAKGLECKAVQLKADYSVKDLTSTAGFESARITAKTDSSVIVSGSGVSDSELISYTQDWYINVNHCRLNIRHNPLIESEIEAYVSFRKKPSENRGEQLGIGTGNKTTYQLKNKNAVKYDSVKLYFDNERILTDFEFNSQVGRITCTPPEGVIVTCDYESDWDEETWSKMNLTDRYSMPEYDVSDFRFTRPESDSGIKSVCAVKILLKSKTGSTVKESIGKGTGKTQTYKLKHKVRDGNITVYSNNTKLSEKKYILLDDTQYIRIAGTSGQALTATYDWVSETPAIEQFIAVFSE